MIATIITGAVSILCTVLTVWAGLARNSKQMEIAQAVTDEKIAELTREVRKHNDFAERIPAIEAKLEAQEKAISRIEGRLSA